MRKAELSGLFAVDIELKSRVVNVLGNEHVAHAGEPAGLGGYLRGNRVGRFHVVAADLDVDRSGKAEIQNGVHKAAGLKVNTELRELLLDFRTNTAHVFIASDFVTFAKAGLNEGGVRSRVGSVDGGKIRGDADVGNDDLQFVLRDDLTDYVLDLLDVLLGELHARAGGRFEVDDELAGIGAREKGDAEKRIEGEHEERSAEQRGGGGQGAQQRRAERPVVAMEHALEVVVEFFGDAAEAGFDGTFADFLVRLMLLDELCAEERHDGHGHDVRSK